MFPCCLLPICEETTSQLLLVVESFSLLCPRFFSPRVMGQTDFSQCRSFAALFLFTSGPGLFVFFLSRRCWFLYYSIFDYFLVLCGARTLSPYEGLSVFFCFWPPRFQISRFGFSLVFLPPRPLGAFLPRLCRKRSNLLPVLTPSPLRKTFCASKCRF